MRHPVVYRVLTIAALAMAVLVPRAALAESEKIELSNFHAQIGKIAQRVIEIVAGEGQSAVKIGGFVGPPEFNSNSGPGIEQSLRLALEQIRPGIVQRKAALTVEGRYKLFNEKKNAEDQAGGDRVFVNLSIEIRDAVDEPVKRFNVELRSPPDIAKLLQVTASLTEKDASLGERNREVKKQAEQPAVFIAGPQVRAKAESKFSVALAVKPRDSAEPAAPRPAVDEGGMAFVEIQPCETYEILVKNDSDDEAAVEITVDGLSVFVFSEVRDAAGAFPLYRNYIVAPHSTATIVGWHLRDKGPDNYASFLVSEYGKAERGGVARPAQRDTGVVFVAISRSFPKGKGAGRGANETGLDPPRSVDVKPVERDLAPPHEFVAIRYSR